MVVIVIFFFFSLLRRVGRLYFFPEVVFFRGGCFSPGGCIFFPAGGCVFSRYGCIFFPEVVFFPRGIFSPEVVFFPQKYFFPGSCIFFPCMLGLVSIAAEIMKASACGWYAARRCGCDF